MDFLQKLLAELGVETPDLKKIGTLANNAIKDVDSLNDLVKEKEGVIDTQRDKLKELDKVKDVLGVDKNLAIDETILEAKLKANTSEELKGIEDKYNTIIANLNTKFDNDVVQYKSKISEYEKSLNTLTIENKLAGILPSINAQEGAIDDIKNNLLIGAVIEGDNILFKDGDTIIRNEKGFTMTIADKLETIKKQKPYLFKLDVSAGSGTTNSGINKSANTGLTDFGSKMIDRAKALGL